MSTFGKAYLLAYNAAQFAGWSYMLYVSAPFFWPTLSGAKSSLALYHAVWPALSLFQTAAVLEILHAAVGLVRSSVFLTAFQVFSRVGVTWAVLYAFPESRSCRGLPLLLLAWQVTEIIRYSFYFFGLLGSVPSILTWLRYTLFIALYPMGVTGELWCGITCLDTLKRERPMSMAMPNKYNFTFDSYAMFILVLLSYAPIFPQLYFHMFGQRKKVLGGGDKSQKKSQ